MTGVDQINGNVDLRSGVLLPIVFPTGDLSHEVMTGLKRRNTGGGFTF